LLLALALLLGALALLLGACGRGAPAPAAVGAPLRVISLSPTLSGVAVALGARERLVGVDQYSLELPGLERLPSLGGLFAADLERAVELRPDLVLGVRSEQQQAFFEALRARGVRCEEIETGGRLDLVLAEFRRVGALLALDAEAEALVARLRAELDAIAASVAGREPRAVALVLDADPLYVAGGGGFVSDLIAIAGGRNVFADLEGAYPRVSFEVLAARAPEVLLDASLAPGRVRDQADARAAWQRFGWVRRVEFLPFGPATRAGADMARGAAQIRDAIHPEAAGPGA
jgi:ABC-type Fe3+-hydroxamate transport system substrate-binding protein